MWFFLFGSVIECSHNAIDLVVDHIYMHNFISVHFFLAVHYFCCCICCVICNTGRIVIVIINAIVFCRNFRFPQLFDYSFPNQPNCEEILSMHEPIVLTSKKFDLFFFCFSANIKKIETFSFINKFRSKSLFIYIIAQQWAKIDHVFYNVEAKKGL